MKIWFDLSNSPHINLFSELIKDLQKDHEVIITCRPLANTIDLLNIHGFEFTVIGRHYGKSFFQKIFGYPVRVWQLYRFLKNKKITVAVSQSSFHSPVAAWLLGVPAIYMNDNEHAMGNIPSFIFAKKILIPEFLDKKKVKKQMARDSKIIQYPGVKEGIYLWQSPINHGEKITIYIRPEPWVAQYYKGAVNFMDNLILYLKDKEKIVLLPRGKDQAVHYEDKKFEGITILKKSKTLGEIASDCKLFIGAGGTMTREMAVLGIPTISVYQDELLDVDKYLISKNMMIHNPDLTGEFIESILLKINHKEANQELLEKGRQAYKLIKQMITEDFN
jgi:uncharacterized protein